MVTEVPGHTARRLAAAASAVVSTVVFLAVLVFARRNLRAGRGDKRGALVLATAAAALQVYSWLWRAHHVASFADEFSVVLAGLANAALSGLLLPLIYLALEPYVRRAIPELLISWARVAEGRLRDPLVGRDLLLGGLAGAVATLALHVANAIPAWIAFPGQTTMYANYAFFEGVHGALRGIGDPAAYALNQALFVLGALFVLRVALRRTWLAGLALAAVSALQANWGENPLLDAIGVAGVVVPLALVATRLGLVGLLAFWHMWALLGSASLPFDPGRWYFGTSLLFLAFVIALFAYAFRISLGNRPLFATEAGAS
jgi:hypothetical protein